MHEVLVNRLEGPSLPSKSVVRLTDRPDMTLDVYRGRKTTIKQHIMDGRTAPRTTTMDTFRKGSRRGRGRGRRYENGNTTAT